MRRVATQRRYTMRTLYRMLLILAIFALIVLLTVSYNLKQYDQPSASRERLALSRKSPAGTSVTSEVTICVVVCGDRLHEALTMLKSALVFTSRPLQFIILAEQNLIPAFDEKLSEWRLISNKTFDFLVRPITFPDGSDVAMWKKLFKPCAAQRLFLPVSGAFVLAS
jgi:UDP-xylose:glucoside alpha-1,3-xylosyltransferase